LEGLRVGTLPVLEQRFAQRPAVGEVIVEGSPGCTQHGGQAIDLDRLDAAVDQRLARRLHPDAPSRPVTPAPFPLHPGVRLACWHLALAIARKSGRDLFCTVLYKIAGMQR